MLHIFLVWWCQHDSHLCVSTDNEDEKVFIILKDSNYRTVTRTRQKNNGLYIQKLKQSGGGQESTFVKRLKFKTGFFVIKPLEEFFLNETNNRSQSVSVTSHLENVVPFPPFFLTNSLSCLWKPCLAELSRNHRSFCFWLHRKHSFFFLLLKSWHESRWSKHWSGFGSMSFKPHSKQNIFVTAPPFRHVAGINVDLPHTSLNSHLRRVKHVHHIFLCIKGEQRAKMSTELPYTCRPCKKELSVC